MNTGWPWAGLGVALTGASSLHLAAAVALSNGFVGPNLSPAQTARVGDAPLRIEVRSVVVKPPLLAPMSERTVESNLQAQPSPADTPSAPPDSMTEPTIDVATPDGRRYFGVDEVDAPAMPRPEWQVDVPLLMGIGVRTFSVEVLISETGVAEQCSVIRIEPEQATALRHSVAAQLCETVLTPAMRRGVAVPSVRHIELLLAPP